MDLQYCWATQETGLLIFIEVFPFVFVRACEKVRCNGRARCTLNALTGPGAPHTYARQGLEPLLTFLCTPSVHSEGVTARRACELFLCFQPPRCTICSECRTT